MGRQFFFGAVSMLSLLSLQAQDKKTIVQAYIDSIQKANDIPGICISFVQNDKQTFDLATGLSDIENRTPMLPNSLLLSGSAPKMYYATIAVMLAAEGKWELDDKLEKYLGKKLWYSRLPNAGSISIKQLLNHSAGVIEYYEQGDFIKRLIAEPDKDWNPEELVEYVLDKKPLFDAGEGFSYSDMNYILLGLAIEALTGTDIYKLVEKKILQPLEMKNTVPSISRTIKGLQKGYSPAGSPFGFSGPTIVNGKFVINPQFEWCGGGYASTTGDWIKFLTGLMQGRLLKADWLDKMKLGIQANLGPGEAYGLGIQVRPTPKMGKGFGHGGWFPGYLTEVEYFPEKNVFIAIQFNTDDFSKIKAHPRQHLVRLAQLISD